MKIAFLFGGQGSQTIGMGKDLYDNFSEAKAVFEEASNQLGFSLQDLCFQGNDRLGLTEFAQPAIVTQSFAGFEVIRKAGIQADFMAGLSLGEYSALGAVGMLPFSELIQLVYRRGNIMNEQLPKNFGGMAAVLGLSEELTEKACAESSDDSGEVTVANYNTLDQIVISGETNALKRAEEKCKEFGAKRVISLAVTGPFHTKYLSKAGEKLGEVIADLTFKENDVPLISNVTADTVSYMDIQQELLAQMVSPVRFAQSIQKLIELGVTEFVEFGPAKTLSAFVRKIDKSVNTYHVCDKESVEKTVEALLK